MSKPKTYRPRGVSGKYVHTIEDLRQLLIGEEIRARQKKFVPQWKIRQELEEIIKKNGHSELKRPMAFSNHLRMKKINETDNNEHAIHKLNAFYVGRLRASIGYMALVLIGLMLI